MPLVEDGPSFLFLISYMVERMGMSKIFEPEFRDIVDAIERDRQLCATYGTLEESRDDEA